MKKLLFLAALAVLVFTLGACGNEETPQTNQGNQQAAATPAPATPAPATTDPAPPTGGERTIIRLA
ncbi:MAG: hypothetical protein FWF78_05230, partial [Defluviitaleaceae bacterium]|nr:hypothetical protein [Defluviitaleaceae bacterium]